MFIQANVPRNPYAAFALMTRQGAMGEDRGPLQRKLLPGLAQTTPVLRSQMMARVARYEGLGEQISALRTALSQVTSFTALRAPGPFSLDALSVTGRVASMGETSASPSGGTGSPGASPSDSTGSPSGTGPVTGTPSGGETRQVAHAAVMRATHGIFLTPGKEATEGSPAQAAKLSTAALQLSPETQTRAELTGGTITMGETPDKTQFGKVTLNGKEISLQTIKATTAQDAAKQIAARLNQFTSQTGVEASVDRESGTRLILRSTTAGSRGEITIEYLREGNKNAGAIGFEVGDHAQGQDGASDLGEVTINGVRTQFGVQKHASVQDALAFMAERLNADHHDLEATVDGDHLLLTSKAKGAGSVIRVEAVTRGASKLLPQHSSNGFTAGIEARGRDGQAGTPADPGVTDFGSITINGIETVFGRLDNRTHTAETAASYLAELINQSNATVRASVEEGRLMLVSTATGEDARIRIDAIAPDSDGTPDNDRALGFLVGAEVRGRVTTETTGPATPGSSTGGSTGSSSGGATGGSRGSTSSDPVSSQASAESTPRAELPAGAAAEAHDQVKEWVRLTNRYLGALGERSQEHPHGDLQGFGRSIGAMLRDPALAAVGLTINGGHLSLDEETFARVLDRDPQSALDALEQFRGTLDPLLASQAYAMSFMRDVAQTLRDRAPEISQALTVQYRLEQRSKELSGWLEALESLMPDWKEQAERLDQLAEEEDPDDEEAAAAREAEKAREADAARAPFAWIENSRPLAPGLWSAN